jgi:hypothetical protein
VPWKAGDRELHGVLELILRRVFGTPVTNSVHCLSLMVDRDGSTSSVWLDRRLACVTATVEAAPFATAVSVSVTVLGAIKSIIILINDDDTTTSGQGHGIRALVAVSLPAPLNTVDSNPGGIERELFTGVRNFVAELVNAEVLADRAILVWHAILLERGKESLIIGIADSVIVVDVFATTIFLVLGLALAGGYWLQVVALRTVTRLDEKAVLGQFSLVEVLNALLITTASGFNGGLSGNILFNDLLVNASEVRISLGICIVSGTVVFDNQRLRGRAVAAPGSGVRAARVGNAVVPDFAGTISSRCSER